MFNIPNILTMSRLLASTAIFVILAIVSGKLQPVESLLVLDIVLALYIIGSVTDFLDGIIARKWGLETIFGRIADPFADKILVCGTLVLLTRFDASGVLPWMVVVVIAREFLVSSLRGYFEGQGMKFGALFSGKFKTTFQYIVVGLLLFHINHTATDELAHLGAKIMVYLLLLVTVLSAVVYIVKAVGLAKEVDNR